MTKLPEQKRVPDAVQFGQEIAEFAMAELKDIGLSIAEVAVKQRRIENVKRRIVHCINTAAAAKIMTGSSTAEAQSWAKAATESCGAAMDERRASF